MNQFIRNIEVVTRDGSSSPLAPARSPMSPLTGILIKLGILKKDLDYHIIRAAMVIIFLFLVIKSGSSTKPRC
jgi:hypothetical protein